MRVIKHITGWVAISVLAGCSSIKPYSNTLPENLRVQTAIDSGSKITSVIAEFDIARVDARCQTDPQGRVYLDKPEVRVGLPVDQPLFLDFFFIRKGILSKNISSVVYSTPLIPRTGYEYVAKVRYSSGIYDVEISENRRGSTMSRVIERQPLGVCGKE